MDRALTTILDYNSGQPEKLDYGQVLQAKQFLKNNDEQVLRIILSEFRNLKPLAYHSYSQLFSVMEDFENADSVNFTKSLLFRPSQPKSASEVQRRADGMIRTTAMTYLQHRAFQGSQRAQSAILDTLHSTDLGAKRLAVWSYYRVIQDRLTAQQTMKKLLPRSEYYLLFE